jgi:hypothetical protein
MKWMRLSEATWKLAAVGQPGGHMTRLGNAYAIDYYTAVEWSAVVGKRTQGWEAKAFWKWRHEPAAVDRLLSTALGALASGRVKFELTKGEWLGVLDEGRTLVDAANAPSLEVQGNELFEMPNPPDAPMPIAVDASASVRATYEAAMLLCWTRDSAYIRWITWGDLCDPDTGTFALGGWLAWVTASDGDRSNQGRSGPVGKFALLMLSMLKPNGYTEVPKGMADNVAAAVVSLLVRADIPNTLRLLRVKAPLGSARLQSAMDELRCADPEGRERWEAALFATRAAAVVAGWPAVARVARGLTASPAVASVVDKLLSAAAVTGGASTTNVDDLDDTLKVRVPLLKQPEVAILPAARRCALVCDKMRAERAPAMHASLGMSVSTVHTSVTGQQVGQSAAKVRRDLLYRGAGMEVFLRIMRDAHKLFLAGNIMQAMQVMFTGRSSNAPDGKPCRLAVKLAWGAVEPGDVDPDMKYEWVSRCVARGGEYLAWAVVQQLVADGDLDLEDTQGVSMDALWDTLRQSGKLWGAKLNLYDMLLKPVYEAVHGGKVRATKEEELYRDPFLNAQLPALVGALMEAVGSQRAGDGSLRHAIAASNQTLALYTSGDSAAITELCKEQAAYINGVLVEGSCDYELQRSDPEVGDPQRPDSALWKERFTRPVAESQARRRWNGVRQAHREELRRQRFRLGGAAAGQIATELPGCSAFCTPPKQQRPAKLADNPNASATEARAEAERKLQGQKNELEQQQRALENRKARHVTAAVLSEDGKSATWGPQSYALESFPADVCPLYALGKLDGFEELCPEGTACTKKHVFDITTTKAKSLRSVRKEKFGKTEDTRGTAGGRGSGGARGAAGKRRGRGSDGRGGGKRARGK